ncbi:MAG TPA: HAMP domain-containing sensor histidine kinase, partial [Pseudomonadales bacterium]|nr:HAMP domain-containing sensor histidine kinase [Pseudomonadales bacterium]
SVLGFTRRIIRSNNANLTEKQLDALETIERNGKHLLDVINDLLDIARIESGKVELVSETVDLTLLLEDIRSCAEILAKNKAIQIEIHNFVTPSLIQTDPVKLRQILNNLLSNAIKYTEKGSVIIEAHLQQTAHCYLVIAIRDTGQGIAADLLPHLFERFNRLGLDNNSKIEGAGLGLTIVKGYVELLGGEIQVDSKLHAGSTFTVKIPVSPADKRIDSVI